MDVIVKARNLCKDYQLGEITVHALKNVTFEIYQGEFIVILGPSGSGKSTLLNMVGGIESVSSGEIYYEDIQLHTANSKDLTRFRRKYVGFIFQFYNLIQGLTALENVELASELSEHPVDAALLLEQVGLLDRANHFPNKLSGGQQQRVSIARALCKNPDILLGDEPTGALDSVTGVQILSLLSEFHKKYRKTIILITHNEKIAQIADRVFCFKDGALEKIRVNTTPLKPQEVDW